MLWKAGQLAIHGWLDAGATVASAAASTSWADFVPAWAMMAVVAWLTTRAGMPTAVAPAGTSARTTAPAPMIAR